MDTRDNNDFEFDIAKPNISAGQTQYENEIKADAKRHWFENVDLHLDLLPLRKDAFWYSPATILSFDYKDLLHVKIYAGGDAEIHVFDTDISCYGEEIEKYGVFTDEDYYNFCRELYANYGDGVLDSETSYFGFYLRPLNNDDAAGFEIDCEDCHTLDEILDFDFLKEVLDEYINDESNAEYLGIDSKEEQEKVTEDKKTITKEMLLKDIVREFGLLKSPLDQDATFILPNGKVVGTKGNFDNAQHINVATYLNNKYGINDLENDSSKFMHSIGAIRFTPWIPAMIIPKKPLTDEQTNVLYDAIKKLSLKVNTDSEVSFMISNYNGDEFVEFESISNPEDVLDCIYRYEIFGKLYK